MTSRAQQHSPNSTTDAVVADFKQQAPPHALRAHPPSGRACFAILALGTLFVAIGYADGRNGTGTGQIWYWAGEIISFTSLAIAATSSALTTRARVWLVLAQAVQQSFVRWMYSPLFFSFPDELLHWTTATDILRTHHLFHVNTGLPVSPVFPGLEVITTAFASMTHLSLFTAGEIVAAVGHCALPVAVFLLIRRVIHNDRIAMVAVVVYAVNPQQPSFASEFIYENPGLLFMAVALYAALPRGRWSATEAVACVLCLAAVVVTHHVTAVVTIVLLFAFGVGTAVSGRFDIRAKRLLWLAAAATAWAAIWVWSVGSAVVGYLSAPINTIAAGIASAGKQKGATVRLPAGAGSLLGRTLSELAAVITVGLLVAVVVILRRRRDGVIDRSGDRPLMLVFTGLAFSYFFILIVRQLASDGAELSTRLLTYASIFTAFAGAIALVSPLGRPLSPLRRGSAIVLMLVIFLGSMTGGWPPQWELLPGRHRVDGFEAGVDRANTLAAKWFGANVPRGQTVACDFTVCSLLGAYADAHVAGNVSAAYYALRFNSSVRTVLRDAGVDYLFVDMRLATQIPITGQYFPNDIQGNKHVRPISQVALIKFDHAPGVNLVYDNGVVRIYDVRRVSHHGS